MCEKCEKKLAKLVVQDKWKEGARNTLESGGKKVRLGGCSRPACWHATGPLLPRLLALFWTRAGEREQGTEQEEAVGSLQQQVHGAPQCRV